MPHSEQDSLQYDLASPGKYRAHCSCGEWTFGRLVHPDQDHAEVDRAWLEHHLADPADD